MAGREKEEKHDTTCNSVEASATPKESNDACRRMKKLGFLIVLQGTVNAYSLSLASEM